MAVYTVQPPHLSKRKLNTKTLKALSMDIGKTNEFIRAVMLLQGMTQRDLAKKSGKTRQHISVILCLGEASQPIGLKSLYDISKALEIDPSILFDMYAREKLNEFIAKDKEKNK